MGSDATDGWSKGEGSNGCKLQGLGEVAQGGEHVVECFAHDAKGAGHGGHAFAHGSTDVGQHVAAGDRAQNAVRAHLHGAGTDRGCCQAAADCAIGCSPGDRGAVTEGDCIED